MSLFLFRIFIAFDVISDNEGSPFPVLLRSISYAMCEVLNSPRKDIDEKWKRKLPLFIGILRLDLNWHAIHSELIMFCKRSLTYFSRLIFLRLHFTFAHLGHNRRCFRQCYQSRLFSTQTCASCSFLSVY